MKENWVTRTAKKRMRWRWEIRTRITRKNWVNGTGRKKRMRRRWRNRTSNRKEKEKRS